MPDLLGLYWTTSGPVVVHYGREWSLFSWEDRCSEAAKVGLAGLGICVPCELSKLTERFGEPCADAARHTDAKIDETINHRRLPGPWGVEVLSEELRNNPIDVIFRRTYETTASQFDAERSEA
jgi:hypothetical protein